MENRDYIEAKTDVLVVGAGGAGLRAAIEAAKSGLNILLLGKEVLGCAHTGMAMGGMNVALVPPATPRQHFKDTMEGGWFINDPNLVKVFTYEMPDRIRDLEDYGLLFDRTPAGEFYTWKGGKQTAPLNVCVGDYTGREMMQALVDQSRRFSLPYLDEFFVTKIFAEGGQVYGAFGIDLKSGKYYFFNAKAVILATGGAGRMYKVTTNAASNTGDGYAMALKVGAELIDMEMVQFHPTGMVVPESVRGVLVTEKVRGHGGKLFNIKKERFLEKYYPEKMELAGRDEITRAIYQEVKEGRGTGNGGVYLDVTHLPKGEVEDKIPDVFEQFLAAGVDIHKELMEVYPTMHHMCGGVRITIDGETNIRGLYAVGEVTGGIHGANRLGGNSIAEGQVFGRRAGIAAAALVKQIRQPQVKTEEVRKTAQTEIEVIEEMRARRKGVSSYALEEELKDTMWNDVGITRDEKRLRKAKEGIRSLRKEAERIKISTCVEKRNKELQDALGVKNMLVTAHAVVEAALFRKESRGAHFRSDYPEMLATWEKNVVVQQRDRRLIVRAEGVPKLKI